MKTLPLLSTLLAASAATLLANGGGYLKGIKSTGPFRPVNVDSVEMVSEKLDIELKQEAAVISITYQLHNPGKAVEVEMGFPCSVAVKTDANGKGVPVQSLPQLEGFTLTADGKAIESKLMEDHATLPAGEGPAEFSARVITGWQVVTLPFAEGQTRTVFVSYRNPYYRSVSYMSDNSHKSAPSMSYLFSAAALWKGVIQSGEVTVRATGIKPDEVILSHPKRFKRDGNQWTWMFNDFEPTMQDDLQIVVGANEFSQWVKEDKKYTGSYVSRAADQRELRNNGTWFFLGWQFTTTASSSLQPNAKLDSRGAWAEGVEGDGIGESLTLTMDKPAKASRLLIHNGHGNAGDLSPRRDADLFRKYNRVKKLGVSVNGEAPFSVILPDAFESECWVDLPQTGAPLKSVKLTIEDVYHGTEFRDTWISGVEVEVPLSKAPVIHRSR